MSTCRTRLWTALVTIALTALPAATWGQPRDAESYLFLLQSNANIKNRSVVNGNVGVNDQRGLLSLGRETRIAGGTVAASDFVKLAPGAEVFDLFANTLRIGRGGPNILGTLTSPVPLPVYVTEPLVVPDPFDPPNFPAAFPIACGGASRFGGVGESFVLPPGSYNVVRVGRFGKMTLLAGTYNICNLRAVRADVDVTGPVTLNVRDRIVVGRDCNFVPVGNLTAADVQVNVGGRTVRIGPRATFNARVFAPNGTLAIGRLANVTGHFVAARFKSDAGFTAEHVPPPTPCGNGQTDPGETCDPPGTAQPPNQNLCRADCTYCGDGIRNGPEQCDDGNTTDDDDCRNDCTARVPVCGDGTVNQASETCEPPGSPQPPNQNLCRADCTYCGDGIKNGVEQCDDGNADDGDACRNDCTPGAPQPCSLDVTKTCAVPAPPSGGNDCQGGVVEMKLRYTGEPCTATTNDQGGRVVCSGDPAFAEPVRLVLTADLSAATVSPSSETIAVGDVVTIAATGDRLKANTSFALQQGGTIAQSLTIHTSCSQPLNVGDQFGSMLLVELTSKDGGTVTLPPPPTPSSTCEAQTAPPPPHCEGKITKLTLRYRGGDCTITPNTQSGKAVCTGNAGATEPVRIVITKDASKISATPATETIGLGDTFALTSSDGDLEADTKFDVRQGTTLLASLAIHTSCSQPLNLGDRFGPVEVVGLDTTQGGSVSLGSQVDYSYVITNTGTSAVGNVAVQDDLLGAVPGSPIPTLAVGETVTLQASTFVEQTTTNVVTVQGQSGAGSCQASASATMTIVTLPPPPAACDSTTKVSTITFRYTGAGCGASNNPQGGKATCTGGANFAEPVRILIRDQSDGSKVYGDEIGVVVGGSVVGTAASANEPKFRAQTLVRIFNAGGAVIEEDSIHTSCSQALAVGDRFGSLEVIGLGLVPK